MIIKLNKNKHLGILGFGWLGSAIARKLVEMNIETTGFFRSQSRMQELCFQGINSIIYNAQVADKFPKNLSIDILIIAIPPSGDLGDKNYGKFMLDIISEANNEGIKKMVFTSSTGIYSDVSGIYKEDGLLGISERSKRLIDAEQAIIKNCDNYLIARLGGLIDDNRNPFSYGKNTSLIGNEPVNMIYRDDAVDAIIHLLLLGNNGVYNIVATEHPTRSEFYESAFIQNSTSPISLNDIELSKKRIINSDKLIDSGYDFKYPNPSKFPMKIGNS